MVAMRTPTIMSTATVTTMTFDEDPFSKRHALPGEPVNRPAGKGSESCDGRAAPQQRVEQSEGTKFATPALLKLQSWLSPAFPIGAYSYSHGLEWAVEQGTVKDRVSLSDWLDADLRFGSGRNDAIFFCEAWRAAQQNSITQLRELAELAAAFRGTSELALESIQQGTACLSLLQRAWPAPFLTAVAAALAERQIEPTLAVIMGAACATHAIALEMALPLFLQSYVANLVTAGLRLVPLGQTDGQLAIAALESSIIEAGAEALAAKLDDLGSAAFMVDLASMAHETQYTRLFRS
jgi:urease accessory protein